MYEKPFAGCGHGQQPTDGLLTTCRLRPDKLGLTYRPDEACSIIRQHSGVTLRSSVHRTSVTELGDPFESIAEKPPALPSSVACTVDPHRSFQPSHWWAQRNCTAVSAVAEQRLGDRIPQSQFCERCLQFPNRGQSSEHALVE